MATVTFTIQIGPDDAPQQVSIDPEDFTIGFMEDLEAATASGKWRDMVPVLGQMLGLGRDTVRAITIRQWKQIGAAMREAAESPNESG